MRFDIFCDIVDNYGDAGVCWRLARRLAQTSPLHNHDSIRLFCNDLELLNKLAGGDALNLASTLQIEILPWSKAKLIEEAPDVVIEAFGCEIPNEYLDKVRANPDAIIINLEYLSAENWIDSHHGLPSPSNGFKKYFFFPGFSAVSGGVLKGPLPSNSAPCPFGLEEAWRNLGDGLNISLFCYEAPEIIKFLNELSQLTQTINLLVCHGQAQHTVSKWLNQDLVLGHTISYKNLQITPIPFVSQDDYDWLLAQCDLNIVRGEDSFVRAQWAAAPFIWQIYPQSDNAHVIKLESFLEKYLSNADQSTATSVNDLMRWQSPKQSLNALDALKNHALTWRNRLATLNQDGDLAEKLREFIKTHSKTK
jgi:uncharacterized repeat protein (TIGR03837 family)